MNYFTDITDANDIVAKFFDNSRLHIKTFMQLTKYAHSIDEDIAVKYNSSIIGASKIDSVFFFYVIRQDDSFLIKYKHLPERLLFDTNEAIFDSLKEECKNAIDYVVEHGIKNTQPAVINNDISIIETIGEKKEKTEDDHSVENTYYYENLEEADREFQRLYKFFELNKDVKIVNCSFPKRLINALTRNGIITLGDLNGVSIYEISRMRWVGRKSIRNLFVGCYDLLEQSGNDKLDNPVIALSPPINDTEEVDEWKTVRDIVEDIAVEKEKCIVTSFGDGFSDRTKLFTMQIEYQLFCIVDSMDNIADREKNIFKRRILDNETLESIGKYHGVSRERIRQLQRRTIRRLVRSIVRNNVYIENVEKIANLFVCAEKEELLFYLANIKAHRENTWICLRHIIADKRDVNTLEETLDAISAKKDIDSKKSSKIQEQKKFFITEEEKERVNISSSSLPITSIVRNINKAAQDLSEKKLDYKLVLKWLVRHDYIYEVKTEEQIIRYPTNKGKESGIFLDRKTSETKGFFYVTYYPPSIQELIVEHANEMQ
jgi:hypothetical protein